MKCVIMVEIDASVTLIDTIRRNGFTMATDGSQMQIKIPNSPPITGRKTKVAFIPHPPCGIDAISKLIEASVANQSSQTQAAAVK